LKEINWNRINKVFSQGLARYKHKILDSIEELNRLKISRVDSLPKIPFENIDAKKLILASKNGDNQEVESLLQNNPSLVYEFDKVHRTALHWATKMKHYSTMKILLTQNSNPNAFDIAQRTPLHYAAKVNSSNSVKVQLT